MRTTLFFIPHSVGPLPLFGWGWIAIVIVFAWAITIAYRWSSNTPLLKLLSDSFSMWLLILGIVVFFAPGMETRFPIPSTVLADSVSGYIPPTNTTPAMRIVGLPIRGYGMFLMAGVLAGVCLISKRGKGIGISPEQILSLSIWSVIGGMIGARVFFVIQKWPEIKGDSLGQKLFEAFKFTEGGLVVYGGLFGGLAVAILWCRQKGVPMLRVADLATPAFLVGLALGRLGCLMNGCCYGGVCEQGLPAITFPMGSPPYLDQLVAGKLVGIGWVSGQSNDGSARIASVAPDSWAEANKLKSGDRIENPDDFMILPPPVDFDPAGPTEVRLLWVRNGQDWSPGIPLPARSLPTHPSQIYAAINAILLCGFLFWIWPNTIRPGIVLGLGLVGYGISRILEEFIRVDEAGQFGTALSISQWISIAGILMGLVILGISRIHGKISGRVQFD